MLGVGETVKLDACVRVGEPESLERSEDVPARRLRGAAFGQQPGELLLRAERVTGLGFDQSEDEE